MSKIQPGQGIHESDGEPHTCVEPHGEHECGRGLGPRGVHSYLPALTHRCACGFEWDMEAPEDYREEYRERARGLLAEHKLTLRTCWECNSAHEHLKEGEDVVLLCFSCGHYYLGAVKL